MDTEQRLVKAVTHCRVCGYELVNWILNFGQMPLANRYLKTKDEEDIDAPLEVMMCLNCGCVQLRHTVDPKILFSEYLYTSSTSGTLADYYRQYAQDTASKLGWRPGDERFAVGIGGNDGVLEKEYQKLGFKVLNVEPAINIAALSYRSGVPTKCGFFNEAMAVGMVEDFGQADLITCNHCFAHMHNVHDVVKGIKLLLKPGGTFVFEESYWKDMVAGNHFDQIYHEHVFYWTVRALNMLFDKNDMCIVNVDYTKSQGGSIRVYVQRFDEARPLPGSEEPMRYEDELFDLSTYEKWNRRIADWWDACTVFLRDLKSVSCYGAPAKFTMIAQQLDFKDKFPPIQYVVEDMDAKVGRFTPGSHIPIVHKDHFIEYPTDYCIITAQNYADEIIKSNPQYRGKWIVLKSEPRFL